MKKQRHSFIYILLIVFFSSLIIGSSFLLVQRLLTDQEYEKDTKSLKSLIKEPEVSHAESAETSSTALKTDTENEETSSSMKADYKSRYADLISQNSEFLGWIRIEDTNIDLPVVWRKNDNDFYLHHGFDLTESVYGVPFLGGNCDPTPGSSCNNYVIYGHHMKTGLVFSNLEKYRDQSFADTHPDVTFNTIYEDGIYEVFGACAIGVDDDSNFQYYNETSMDSKEFTSFVKKVKERSLIKSDIEPVYGDRLLTLSTCEYTHTNGRFVLFAKKKN